MAPLQPSALLISALPVPACIGVAGVCADAILAELVRCKRAWCDSLFVAGVALVAVAVVVVVVVAVVAVVVVVPVALRLVVASLTPARLAM